MIMQKVSAYIPCCNNAATIAQTIESIKRQTWPVDELFVVDDKSIDNSREIVESLGVRIICSKEHLGRGAVRALAMKEAKNDLVFCCDATNAIEPNFVERALIYFEDPKLAAVYGQIHLDNPRNAVECWAQIHLFKGKVKFDVRHKSPLITYGTIVRKTTINEVGNYNRDLRHTEDGDLGERLLDVGYDIIFDPTLIVTSYAKYSLGRVLERYWRWHAGKSEKVSLRNYFKQIVYSVKVMALDDLKDKDPLRALISFYIPHYQFWRSIFRTFGRKKPEVAHAKRILVLHPYLEGRESEISKGLYPSSHLWGIDGLQKAGWKIEHVKTKDNSLLCKIARKISDCTRGRFSDINAEFKVLRLLKRTDIIYDVSGTLLFLPLLRSLRIIKTKIVVWIFRLPQKAPFWKFRNLNYSRLVMKGCDGILCLTKRAESYYSKKFPQSLVKNIDWGTDLELFKPMSDAIEGEYFFSVGKIERDYKTLIEAFSRIKYSCKIIAQEKHFEEMDIPKYVEFIKGSTNPPDAAISYPELQEYYAKAKAVLIPLAADDPDDTCGYTNLLEAMAMGKPVIMTRSGALDIDVEALGIGIYVKPYDVEGWVHALKSILEDPQRAFQMGQRARKLAEEYYNVDRFGKDLCKYFKGVCKC